MVKSNTPSRYQDKFAYNIFTQFVQGKKEAAVRLVQTAYTKEQAAFLSASVAALLSTMAGDKGGTMALEFIEMLRPKEGGNHGN